MSRDDWEEMPDKGPTIEEKTRWRSRRRKGRKRYAIEQRYVGPERRFLSWMWNRSWHMKSRYHTTKQRDQALAHFNHRRKNSHDLYRQWKFRPVELGGSEGSPERS
jgi:hypothetical protein